MKSLLKTSFAISIVLLGLVAFLQKPAQAQEPSSGSAGTLATTTKGYTENPGGCGVNAGGEGIGDDSKACLTPDCTATAAAPAVAPPGERTK